MEYSLKVKPEIAVEFKVNPTARGPGDVSCAMQLSQIHPLKSSEENYDEHRLNLNMRMLRNREGLNAPLKLAMELQSAKKINRLPFLPSSNAQFDVLLGRDEIIEFSDFLGTEEFGEHMRQPHAAMEKSLGIL